MCVVGSICRKSEARFLRVHEDLARQSEGGVQTSGGPELQICSRSGLSSRMTATPSFIRADEKTAWGSDAR